MNTMIQQCEYKLFKKKLENFVKNSAINARAKRNKQKTIPITEPERFCINGIEISMEYYKWSKTAGPKSTFISIGWLDIICEFDSNYEITGFKNMYSDSAKKDVGITVAQKVFDKMTELCEDCCEVWTKKELGLNHGKEPNENLKRFLNQYIALNDECNRLISLYPLKEKKIH